MLIYWLWMAHRPKVSDRCKAALLRHFGDPEGVYFADMKALSEMEGITQDAVEALKDKDLSQAQQILEVCEEKKLRILTLRDEAYPEKLKNIIDPPLVLYCKGQLPDFDRNPVVGVVGTRRASVYGLKTAKSMGFQIALCGGIVVSGMAKGIDAMAMNGAMLAGKTTVGVLGCGADIVYPAANKELFQNVERYGCILSEFAPGTPPVKWNFPKRNRIISGLSNGVLVVEAPEKSGALITAGQALEQGRDVFVIPGNIDQEGFVGSNRLLRDGASFVSSGWDILSEYAFLYPDKVREAPRAAVPEISSLNQNPEKEQPKVAQKPLLPDNKPNQKKNLEKIAIDKEASGSYSDVNDVLSRLSGDEKRIASVLLQGERLVDDVIAETRLSTGKLLGLLTIMELKGVIRRLPGKRISLK